MLPRLINIEAPSHPKSARKGYSSLQNFSSGLFTILMKNVGILDSTPSLNAEMPLMFLSEALSFILIVPVDWTGNPHDMSENEESPSIFLRDWLFTIER